MNKVFLAGAALGALTIGAQAADYNPITARPALPQAVSGDLALFGGWSSYSSNEGDSAGSSSIGGLARATVYLSPGMSVQFDLGAENPFAGSSSGFEGDNYSVVDLAGHVSWRNPANLVGLFASVGYNGWWGDRFATVGAEGMLFMGNLHLYGQVGGTFDVMGGSNVQDWYVHGEGRYFLNPNLMLAANLGFVGQSDNGESETAIRWGLDLEAKMDNSPFGGFISYQGYRLSEDETMTSHTILAGIKIHLNAMSLQQASQSGTTLSDKNPLTGTNHLRFNDWE